MRKFFALSLFALSSFAFAAPAAQAQEAPPVTQVASVSPISLIFGFVSGEYERAYSSSSTIGAGGSFYSTDGWNYISADAKYRFYPQGKALKGFSIGGSGGVTYLGSDADDYGLDSDYDDSAYALNAGVSLDYQWLLGEQDNFAVTLGAGGKRIFPMGSDVGGAALGYPTLRISVGYGF